MSMVVVVVIVLGIGNNGYNGSVVIVLGIAISG